MTVNLFDTIEFGAPIPFTRLLGLVLTRFDSGCSELLYESRPEHANSFGVAHGGIVMTLLDVAMATAARSLAPETGAVTIEMKTSFMRAATGTLRCEGSVKHRTSSFAFMEATVYNAQNEACAHATGTFKYVKRRPAVPGGEGVISTD